MRRVAARVFLGKKEEEVSESSKNRQATEVDMLATARDVQWTAETFLGHGAIKLVAPAKVNLFLGVGARRADGFHDVANIMHAVALHDIMYMHQAPWTSEEDASDLPDHLAVGGPEDNVLVSIDCTDKTGVGAAALSIPARDNIAFKAIDALARVLGRTDRVKLSLRIEKNIPHEGGLGGGSSNAAAALFGAAHFWGVAEGDPAIEEAAQQLGSDVAFFLHGGCALFTGAGEVFDHALEPAKMPLVLVKPAAGVSTPAAYRTFDENPVPIPAACDVRAHEARAAEDVPLFNNLAPVAEKLLPELAEVREWLVAQSGIASPNDVLLTGSGSVTYARTQDFSAACAIAAAAQARGWWARATTLSSLRVAKLPQR